MRRWAVAALAAVALLAVGSTESSAQQGAVQPVHDPAVIKCGRYYYLFSTGEGIPVRRSEEFVHWQHVGRVFKEDVPAWANREIPGSTNLWAPDISHFNGQYHLYYSVSNFGSQRSCIALATNKTLDPASPDYEWVDQGEVVESIPGRCDFNAIDPALVLDEYNRPWLAFGSFWGGIKLVRLDKQTGKRASDAAKVHTLATRPQHRAIEAAFIVRKKGFYYLFVSFDRCCRGVDSSYKTMVGRSEQVTGPYLDRNGRPMREGGGTLVLAGHEHWKGPGHNAVILEPDGDWLVHHTYDARHNGVPTLQIRPLVWAADGWPLAGEPIVQSLPARRRRSAPDVVGTWDHSVNYGKAQTIRLLPEGKINDPQGSATWSVRGFVLSLRWPRTGAPDGAWIDECIIAPDGKSYIGRNQSGMVIRGVAATAPQH